MNKNLRLLKRGVGVVLFSMVLIAIDQISKKIAFNYLDMKDAFAVEILPFFNLVKVWNKGVSFGLFSNLSYGPVILTVVALCLVAILFVWVMRVKTFFWIIALSLIIGGAFGNIIDRFFLGKVADFLDFHILAYHWPAFNFADICVSIGVFLLLLDELILRTEAKAGNLAQSSESEKV